MKIEIKNRPLIVYKQWKNVRVPDVDRFLFNVLVNLSQLYSSLSLISL